MLALTGLNQVILFASLQVIWSFDMLNRIEEIKEEH